MMMEFMVSSITVDVKRCPGYGSEVCFLTETQGMDGFLGSVVGRDGKGALECNGYVGGGF